MQRVATMNVAHLIATVEGYPSLWDPCHDDYKKKYVKQKAWREICEEVIDGYTELDAGSKLVTEKAVKARWFNVKDYFVKSVRAETNSTPTQDTLVKKKYMYYDLLLFLKKTISLESADESDQKTELDSLSDDIPISTPRKRQWRKVNNTHIHDNTRPVVDSINPMKDEDIAFLESILPAIRKIPEEKKIEFQIELLQLVKKYSKEGCTSDTANIPYRYLKTYQKNSARHNRENGNQVKITPKLFETVVKIDQDEPQTKFFEITFSEDELIND